MVGVSKSLVYIHDASAKIQTGETAISLLNPDICAFHAFPLSQRAVVSHGQGIKAIVSMIHQSETLDFFDSGPQADRAQRAFRKGAIADDFHAIGNDDFFQRFAHIAQLDRNFCKA